MTGGGTADSASNRRPQATVKDYFDLGEELSKMSAPAAPKPATPSDDFFDLAAELRDELSTFRLIAARGSAESRPWMIFLRISRRVSRSRRKQDADTHYNLGVSYKKWGSG
jgi:hypothetical protein